MANQQTGAMLCPNCKKLISADESHCPYCGMSHPGAGWRRSVKILNFHNPDQLVKAIIWLNVGMYVLALIFNLSSVRISSNPFGLLSPAGKSLLFLGMIGTVPIDSYHRWWTLLSANYLHGGILHIAFNMMALRQIAPFIIREYGLYRMVILYTVGGVMGLWISYLAGTKFCVGASAALCGLFGAALYYGKSRGGTYGHAVYRQVGSWVIGIFVIGLLIPNIDNWSHAGGLGGGMLLAFLLGYEEKNRENFFHRFLAGVCAALTLTVLIWAIVSGAYYQILSKN